MVLKYFWMGSPWNLNGFPMHFEWISNWFWNAFQWILKGIPLDFGLIPDVCLCYWLALSSIILLAPTSRALGSLILHCFSYFSYVLHCCVYDLGSVFIVLSTVVAYVRCLSFFVVSAVGWLFFFVRVLSVHVRRASGPPYFLFPATSGMLSRPLDSLSSISRIRLLI